MKTLQPTHLAPSRRDRSVGVGGKGQPRAINVRGANGSGKSYLVSQWMKEQGAIPYPRLSNLLGSTTAIRYPQYYVLGDGGRVIGNYQRDCGGCDTIHTQNEVRERIVEGLDQKSKYVLFEGVVLSTIFESWYQFSQSIGGMLWVYLDTPLEVCLKRVNSRNYGAEFKKQLVADKIRNINSTRVKAEAAGEPVVVLHWERAYEEFSALMERL